MKKITVILIFWALTYTVFAQDKQATSTPATTSEINTIFGKGGVNCKIPLGYFIEINDGFTRFGHQNVFLPGISMGLILNHHWTIGMTGSFIGNPNGVNFKHSSHDSTGNSIHRDNRLRGGYGGLLLEYTLFPQSRVHVVFPLMIGCGYMSMSHYTNIDSTLTDQDYHHSSTSGDHFFVIEPGVKLECNVIKNLRIGFGLSYRYAPDLDLRHAPSDLINQFTAKLSFRFGKF